MPEYYQLPTIETGTTDEGASGGKHNGDDEDILHTYLKQLSRTPLLTHAEEIDLARRIQQGDQQAFHRMVEANLTFVVKMARRYVGQGTEFADLIAEGNLGLMHAVKKYDPELGWRFSTYAGWWVKQAIEKAVLTQGHTIRIPLHVGKAMFKLNGVIRELTQRLKTPPTAVQIAEAAGKTEGEVRRLLSYGTLRHGQSLNYWIYGDDTTGTTPIDNVPDPGGEWLYEMEAEQPDALAVEEDVAGTLDDAYERWLERLTAPQAVAVAETYGLWGEDGKTTEQVARKMRVDPQVVECLLRAALASLREFAEEEGYSCSDLLH